MRRYRSKVIVLWSLIVGNVQYFIDLKTKLGLTLRRSLMLSVNLSKVLLTTIPSVQFSILLAPLTVLLILVILSMVLAVPIR